MQRLLRLRLVGPALLCVALLSGCSSDAADDASELPDGPDAPAASALTASQFKEPVAADLDHALTAHADVDPDKVIPRDLLGNALAFYDLNESQISNKKWLVVVDFSKSSGKKRFFLIDMTSGQVEPHVTTHGRGSDPNNTGTAQRFSNVPNSNMSSLGYYITGEIYTGKHGRSMRLDGVSKTNDKVRDRSIVIHTADYVDDDNTDRQGRSEGCMVLDSAIKDKVIDKLHDGAVIYAEVSGKITVPAITRPAPAPADGNN